MAYPVVESRTTNDDTARSGTTFSLDYPAGIQAGETLLAFISTTTNSDSISFPAGWTQLYQEDSTDVLSSPYFLNVGIFVRKADGTESGSVSVTVVNDFSCGQMLRISGAADPTVTPPYVSDGFWQQNASAAGTPISCPSLNNMNLIGNEFGQYDRYLSIVAMFYMSDYSVVTQYPDNYSNFQDVASRRTSIDDCGVHVGHRDIQSIGEFPGRWVTTQDVANQARYNTCIIVYPKERYVAPSTFPYINRAAFSTDAQRSASTSFNLILPPTEPGDILIGAVAVHNALSDTVTWPSDWNELYDQTASGGGNNMMSSVAWKVADGSDRRTVNLTVDANPTCGVAFTVTNIPDPEPTVGDSFEWNDNGGGFAQTHTAGSITPSAGSDNYLWVGIYAVENNDGSYSTFPTDYDGRFAVVGEWGVTTDDVMIVVCHSNDETARASLTSASLTTGSSLADVCSQFVFYPGSFDRDDWWYLNWRGKGRNGLM